MFDSASPSDIVAFLQRIDSTVLPGRSPIQAWAEFLKKNGGGSGSINEMERNWMLGKSATSAGKSSSDMVDNYGTVKGVSGSKGDKVRNYLRTAATQ